ncbi:MAG: hypothetical protein ACXWO7_00325 [Candidatus Limnocylindrales bacterium]
MPDEQQIDPEPTGGKATTGPINDERKVDEDVEGHFIGRALAAGELVRGSASRPHGKVDDDLKPLTKKFPSMREDGAAKK